MALRALAEVNLAAIDRNVRLLRSTIGGASLCAVVKADAYGHGAAPVARSALDAGAQLLAVAAASEALALREDGIRDAPILVLGAISEEELPMALAARAEVVAWDERFIKLLSGHRVRVHVKLDSGMGRLGPVRRVRGSRSPRRLMPNRGSTLPASRRTSPPAMGTSSSPPPSWRCSPRSPPRSPGPG